MCTLMPCTCGKSLGSSSQCRQAFSKYKDDLWQTAIPIFFPLVFPAISLPGDRRSLSKLRQKQIEKLKRHPPSLPNPKFAAPNWLRRKKSSKRKNWVSSRWRSRRANERLKPRRMPASGNNGLIKGCRNFFRNLYQNRLLMKNFMAAFNRHKYFSSNWGKLKNSTP